MSGVAEAAWSTLRRHDQRVQRMLDDPDCSGDLLLIGIALARHIDLGSARGSIKDAIAPVMNDGSTYWWYAVRATLRSDVRRFRPDDSRGACQAPMVRRDGACGRHGTNYRPYIDAETGERGWVAACGRAEHRAWMDARVALLRRLYDEAAARDEVPVPPANTGGVLARHLPEVNWSAIWRRLDPEWTPAPEGEQRFAPPRLQMVLGDDERDETQVPQPTRLRLVDVGITMNPEEDT